jgi:hypothetical protein
MRSASSPTDNSQNLIDTFRELRAWTDDQLATKGLLPQLPSRIRVGEASVITAADIARLKEDIALLIKLEGKRSFRSGVIVNTVFFILGLVGGVVLNALRTASWWPF